MTLPLPRRRNTSSTVKRANWIGRYLEVERGMDKELFEALVQATKGIDESFAALAGKKTKSAATRRLQLALAHKEIRKQMESLFGDVSGIVKDYHSVAARAAIDAVLYDEKRLLTKIFGTKAAVEQYGKSLRQTATRNIESVMTRVLETKIPLSKRVYKTRALSQGMVDRAINNGLARGDSFEQIAKSVHHLIDPNTPGGVTYAAKRLARTETNNAYHAQSIHSAQEQPWVTEMRWYLSKRHSSDAGDPCEDYANQGLFPIEHVPPKPHPHCRCFVTPEPVSDAELEHAFTSGQYDSYLDDFIAGDSPAPLEMEHSPKATSTTKAAQPSGWTGPLVAKPAANKQVRQVTDDIWLKYDTSSSFTQMAREGSRTVQVKGYKGGLSSPGKKALLSQADDLVADDSIAFDIGREMTARVAYAPASKESVYHGTRLTSAQLERLRKSDDLSMPLTTFKTDVAQALDGVGDRSGTERIVFEVGNGAKVVDVGDSRIAMGSFEIEGVSEKFDSKGDKYNLVRLKQFDPREFDADTPRGEHIYDLDLIKGTRKTESMNTLKGTSSSATMSDKKIRPPEEPKKPRPEFKTTAQEIEEAKTVQAVRKIMEDKHELTITGWTPAKIDMTSAKEIATSLDKLMEDNYDAAQSLTHVEIWSATKMKTAYAHIQPEFNGTTKMRLNKDFTSNYAVMKAAKEHGESVKWSTIGSSKKPWHSTVTHEFGHVIDWWATKMNKHTELIGVIKEEYAKDVLRRTGVKWPSPILSIEERQLAIRRWLQGSTNSKVFNGAAPSRYSIRNPGKSQTNVEQWGFHDVELVAEAFTDVQNNGDDAKPVSTAVYKWFMEKVREKEDSLL